MLALVATLLLAAQAAGSPDTLKVATWNLEWLIAPSVFKPLKRTCVPQGQAVHAAERRLPCDVAQRLERSSRDFAVLARYARQLDADVIALQEVDGIDAARLVFAGYEFCFSGSRHLQNTGFAIRAGIQRRCGPDLTRLSLDDTVRRGVELVLFPGEPRELHLLNVHLKSGCGQKPLDSSDGACRMLARQVPVLAEWVRAQESAGTRFALLGDFNRELLGETGPARSADGRPLQVWPEIHHNAAAGSNLVNAAEAGGAGQVFRNCVPGQPHKAYIDHILLGRALSAALIPGSLERVTFSATDARHARLSDHCPLSVRLTMRQIPSMDGSSHCSLLDAACRQSHDFLGSAVPR